MKNSIRMHLKIPAVCIALCAAALFAAGCGTTMKVTHLDMQTGRFPTSKKVSTNGIRLSKPLNVDEFKQLLYIRHDSSVQKDFIRSGFSSQNDLREFLKGSFANLRFFNSVKDTREMEAFVMSGGQTNNIGNVTNMVTLGKLQKQIGNFLLADYSVTWFGDRLYTFEVFLINPADGETVLHVTHQAVKRVGLDKPLFYPVLNSVKDWIEENRTSKH